MHVMYFTERPYYHVPEDEIIKNGGFYNTPNAFYDAHKARELHNRYLDEKLYAEEVGFDGVVLNEHHATPYCMGSVMDVEAAILARITKRVKIVLLGNPLPVADPLRLAEELAEIDVISGGRLVTGWVRGAGAEQLANSINPAHNRERFEEAHDFIIKAWTTPGPWRYEGKHYHYRMVNPWALPMQKPIPQSYIPGVVSPETILWAAKHRYPYVALATFLEPTTEVWNMYADAAAQAGFQAGPENFGYVQRVIVAETQEKAQELGKGYLYGGGQPAFSRPEWTFPSGYLSKAATQRLAKTFTDPKTGKALLSAVDSESGMDVEAAKKKIYATYEDQQRNGQFIIGTPKTVLPKIRHLMEVLRPGVFCIYHNEGPMSHADTMTSIRLLGQEVLPAMHEIAKELDLPSPDDVKPGSRRLPPSGKRDPVIDAAALAA